MTHMQGVVPNRSPASTSSAARRPQPAACGGEDGSEADRVAATLREAWTSPDPAICTRFATQRFLEQIAFEDGEDAIRSCEEDQARSAVDTARISDVEVSGESATAHVSLTGGGVNDGQTYQVALVKDDDQWKLDRLVSFVELDRESLRAGLREDAIEDGYSEQAARCAVRELDKRSASALEELLPSGDEQRLLAVLEPCLDHETLLNSVREALRFNPDLTQAQIECAIDRLTQLSENELREVIVSGDQERLRALLLPCFSNEPSPTASAPSRPSRSADLECDASCFGRPSTYSRRLELWLCIAASGRRKQDSNRSPAGRAAVARLWPAEQPTRPDRQR
jgi:hypothetical protein